MTMVFKVAGPGWLDCLKASDPVCVSGDRVDGAIT
jgi:Cu/Ag efflux protein CusF